MAKKSYKLWDAHVHLFPERLLEAVWKWFDKNTAGFPYRRLGCGEITRHLVEMGVERAFLLVYAHKAGVSADINRWLSEFSLKNQMYLPFGCVHPHDGNLAGVMEEALGQYQFYGFKIHYAVIQMRADDPGFTPIYKELEKRGRILVAHAGTAPLPGGWLGMDVFEEVLDSHPGMLVQLAHLGHFELDRVVCLMRKYPNLHLDTAWAMGNSFFPVDREAIRELIMEFPERILYGSDFPIIPEDPCIAVGKILDLSLPEVVTRGVLSGNAERMVERVSLKKL